MIDDAIESMDKPSMEAGRIVSNEWVLPNLRGEEKEGDDDVVFQALLDHEATILGGATNDNDNDGGGGVTVSQTQSQYQTQTHDDDNDGGGGGGASLASDRVITATHPDVKKYLKDAYPLHSACRDGASLDVIKYLVEEADGDNKGKELLGKEDEDGSYPLHLACQGGASLKVIKYLVEEADGDKGKELLGKADNNVMYPLHCACQGGASLDVIKYLVLSPKRLTSIRTSRKRKALTQPLLEESDGDLKELLDKADRYGSYPLHLACHGGASLEVIKYLVEEADSDKGKELLGKANENGIYPLHYACYGGASLDVIKYLVEEADGDKGKELLGKADNKGKYPLHWARTKGASPDVIKYLIQMNPDPLQHKDDSGLSALDHMDNDALQATCGTHQLGSVPDKSFPNDNMEANCQSTIWNETDKVVYVILSDRTIETLKSTSSSTDMSPTIAGNTLASGSVGIADTKKDMGPTPPQITPILPCESRTFNLESTYYYVTCYTKNASDRNVFHEVNKRVKGTDNYKIEPHCLENCLFVAELENLFGKETFLLSVPAPVSKMDTTTPPTADDVGQGGSSQRRTDPPVADDVGHCGSSQRGRIQGQYRAVKDRARTRTMIPQATTTGAGYHFSRKLILGRNVSPLFGIKQTRSFTSSYQTEPSEQ
eukprot:scaffold5864_cov93-Skeletonema_dohrnii-CCMP3373.AAC.5